MELGRKISDGARFLVAMSGGVDSALVAALLRRDGFECVGINMRTHKATEADIRSGKKFQTCCSPEDASDARAVALQEDLPFYVLDLEAEFHDAVVKPFINDYLQGRTPNPCVLCNNHLKLGVLLDKAKLYGCDFVATGHYAWVVQNEESGRYELRRPVDLAKDQTYYLFGLTQDQLSRFVCPLGGYTKAEVRQQSREFGLGVSEKPESMEICFVPDNDYRNFLRKKVDAGVISSGDFVLATGEVIGRHEGAACYTIGQRRGLGVSYAQPLYVVDILAETNVVVLGLESETYAAGLVCDRMNWVALAEPTEEIAVESQIRYRHKPVASRLRARGDGSWEVLFDLPQRSVAPGQAVVFYRGDVVCGGGWIKERIALDLSDELSSEAAEVAS